MYTFPWQVSLGTPPGMIAVGCGISPARLPTYHSHLSSGTYLLLCSQSSTCQPTETDPMDDSVSAADQGEFA